VGLSETPDRFPFQVKVSLLTPEIIEIPKSSIPEPLLNPTTGNLDNAQEPAHAETLFALIQSRSA
jgi:hypothetical protein